MIDSALKENDRVSPSNFIPAIRLTTLDNGNSFFERGKIFNLVNIRVDYFFTHTETEIYENQQHNAPRKQYVITLKGKLKFTVTDGQSFILEPGIILLAEDVEGDGHIWEMVEGSTWERLYLVTDPKADNYFIADET